MKKHNKLPIIEKFKTEEFPTMAISQSLRFTNKDECSRIGRLKIGVENLQILSEVITEFVSKTEKSLILLIVSLKGYIFKYVGFPETNIVIVYILFVLILLTYQDTKYNI